MLLCEHFGIAPVEEEYWCNALPVSMTLETRTIAPTRWEAIAPDGATIVCARVAIDAASDDFYRQYWRNGEEITAARLRQIYGIQK